MIGIFHWIARATLAAFLAASVAQAQTPAENYPVEVATAVNVSAFASMSMTQDRRRAVVKQSNSVELWDVTSGARLVRAFDAGGIVSGMAVSADGKRVGGSTNDKVIVWDAASGRVLRTWTFNDGLRTADALEFSHDGTRLYAAGYPSGLVGTSLIGWSIASGQQLFSHRSQISSVIAKSPDGRLFAADLNAYTNCLQKCVAAGKVVVFDENGRIIRSVPSNYTDAIAFSPDGKWLATGGRGDNGKGGFPKFGHLRIWDLASGALVKTLAAPEYSADTLAWSPDSKVLVSGDRNSLIFWNTSNWSVRFTSPGRQGGAFFLSNTSLLLSQVGIHVFDLTRGEKTATISRHSGDRSFDVDAQGAFFVQKDGVLNINLVNGEVIRTPRGSSLVPWPVNSFRVGVASDSSSGTHTLVDFSKSEAPRRFLENFPQRWAASMSRDGGVVALTDFANITAVDTRSGKVLSSFAGQYPTYVQLKQDGRQLILAKTNSVEIWDVTGKLRAKARGDFGDPQKLLLAPDGERLLIFTGNYKAELWTTAGPRLVRKFDVKRGAEGGLMDADFHPKEPQAITAGLDGRLRLVALDSGAVIREFAGHRTIVHQVRFSTDGARLVSRGDDGVKIWDTASGALLVTYYLRSDGDWALMTPEGFFDATGEGTDAISVVRGLEVLSLDQVYQTLYRPDLVREKLAGDPTGKVRAAAAKLDLTKVVQSGTAPKVAGVSPPAGTVVNEDQITAEVEITPQVGGLGRVEWRVNGVTLGIEEKPELPAGGGPLKLTRTLGLEEGDNRIEVIAFNERNLIASEPARLDVKWEVTGPRAQPRLFVMAVGVNDYWDSRIRLKYAGPDAKSIAEAFQKAGRGIYQEVTVTTLLDDQVTRPKLEKAFADLAGKVRPRDVFVFFLAGHGKTVEGNYYFIPQDFRYRGEESIVKDGVGQDQWQSWLSRVAAKKSVLIYDTCESGSLTAERGTTRGLERVAALERMTRAMGRTVLSASTDDAPALEGYQGHGVFTYAVLDALGRADANGDGFIDITELAGFVDAQVPEISEQAFKLRQIPQMKIVGSNFPLLTKTSVIDAPGPGPAVAIPTRPTHVVIAPADVLEARGGATVQKIAPGTLVTVVETAEGWTIVAREGRRLGYVAANQLAPLQ